jgi:lysophospholipase L1-like esterase
MLLVIALPCAALLVLGAVSALAASNLVGNPGFESSFAGTQYEGTVSPNFGNWIAYSFRHSIPLPAEAHAPSPVHGDSASGEIVNPAGVGSALFIQDIQSFDPNSTYTFSGWVYPVTGEQYFNLEFGWDRGSAGRTTGGSGINITPAATVFSAWQQSGSAAPALTYNAWHHIQLVVSSATLTSELFVDGSCQGVSPPGQLVPSGSPSTILIGDGSAPPSESHFYWDDVELVSGVQASGCPGGSGSSIGNPTPSGGGVSGGGRYVAMGDSYSSGEGTASYDRGTDTSTNKCHRSSEDASKASYPRLLQLDSNTVPSNMTFVACSGAVIDDILNRSQYPDQPPQLQALGSDVTLVTISIGGDDLGFKHVLEECVNEGPAHFRSDDTCVGQDSELRDKLWGSAPLNTRLIKLYRAIHQRAPNARILVMGYPRLFPPGSDNSCGLPGLPYMDSFKTAWLNEWAETLDAYLEETVNASGVAEYVSTLNAMTDSSGVDHSACGNSDPWINELQLFHPSLFGYSVESFHPNPLGYVAFAGALLARIDGAPGGATFTIAQGQIVGPSVTVPPAASSLTVGVDWPGSTIATSLISPKGKLISPHTLAKMHNVQHEVGPTYEIYSIANPEPGHWQIRALGVSVAAVGEPVKISVRTQRRRHRPPIARASARPTHGRTPLGVLLSARGSRAVEGRLARYVWDFGDGHKGRGRTTRHTYRHAGRYTALLEVIDTAGARTLASTKTITITIRR